ncbi:MAG: hypothetical protein F9K45_11520, partial [Melioribacteraceae bacterium]
MKKRFLQIAVFSLILALSGILSAGAFLNYFNTRSDNGNVIISWQTGQETNVRNFVIERAPFNGTYIDIATIAAKGNNSTYEYVDESAYKTNDQVYIYRLRIVDNDGSTSYSGLSQVAHSVSGIKQTWGSIKA